MFRSSLIVAAFAAFAGFVSFLNQVVVARNFGASTQMDAYLLAISLPLTISALLVGVLGYQLVPTLQHTTTSTGSCAALVSSLAWGLGGAGIIIALGCGFAAPTLLRGLNPTISEEQVRLAVPIARLAWLSLPLAVVSAVYSAALQVRERFFSSTIFQSAPVLGSLLFCVLGANYFGVSSLVLGLLAGHVVLNLGLKIALGSSPIAARDWQGLRLMLKHTPYSFAALAIFIIYPVVDAFWGSKIGPSAISYLGYAQRLIVGLSTIIVTAVTTVIFPRLAKLAAEGEHKALLENLAVSIRYMAVCMVPVAAVLSVLRLPVLQILFQRGAFSLTDAQNLAQLFPWMLAGMVAMSSAALVFKALFSLKATRAAGVISLVGTAAYFGLSGIMHQRLGVVGIGVAYAASWWLVLVLGLVQLYKGHMQIFSHAGRFVRNVSIAAGFAAIAAWLSAGMLPADNSVAALRRICIVFADSTLAGIVYLMLGCGPIKIAEVRTLVSRAGLILRFDKTPKTSAP